MPEGTIPGQGTIPDTHIHTTHIHTIPDTHITVALIMPGGEGPGWALAVAWNLVPAAIGNILGAVLLVALPLWYSFKTRRG